MQGDMTTEVQEKSEKREKSKTINLKAKTVHVDC